jgi:hypothetical protein
VFEQPVSMVTGADSVRDRVLSHCELPSSAVQSRGEQSRARRATRSALDEQRKILALDDSGRYWLHSRFR